MRTIRLDSEGVLADLREAGVVVDSLADLINTDVEYRHALDILAGWLPRLTSPAVRECVVRALAIRKARPHGKVIVDEFWRASAPEEDSLRWAAGNTLEVLAAPSIADEMVTISLDRSLGRSREMVVYGLRKLKDEGSKAALLEVLSDPSVSGHAVSALARRKIPVPKDIIDRLLHDERAWVRKDARKLTPAT